MVKAKALREHLAQSGIAGMPTIKNVQKHLRVARALDCSGQGAAARDVTASDVSVFFLGLVSADDNKNAPAVVRLARASRHYAARSENCDPWPFCGVSENATLGDFLDALFAGRISSAFEPGFTHWNMRFEFQIVAGDFRFFAKLIFEMGDQCHVVHFFGLNDKYGTGTESDQKSELPDPPHVDRICVVRTKVLRDLISFTSNALSPDAGQRADARPEVSSDNLFSNNGHKSAPSNSSLDGER